MSEARKRKQASSPEPRKERGKRRTASLYDAVAGRLNSNGFIPTNATIPPSQAKKWKLQCRRPVSPDADTVPVSFEPMAPDDFLLNTKDAPPRYEEDDVYFAHRYLASHQRLPDSDLLKSLHAYTSDFYSASLGDQAKRDWRSMDETALLALGVLVEEAAADLLGDTGDLTFVEGEDDDPLKMPRAWTGSGWTRSVIRRAPRGKNKPKEKPAAEDKDPDPETSDA